MRQVIRAALGLTLVLAALFAVAPPSEEQAASQTIEADPCSNTVSTATPTPVPTTPVVTETPLATVVGAADAGSSALLDVVELESPSPSPVPAPETATPDPVSPTVTPIPTPTPTPNALPVSNDTGLIDPTLGGAVQVADGSIKVSFDAGDVSERVTVGVTRARPCEQHPAERHIIAEIRLTATATDRNDAEVTTFDQPVDMEISHTLQELIAYKPESLGLYRLDELTGEWVPVPARIEPSAGKVRASLDHFSIYSSQADPDIVLPPDIQFFQADPQSLSSSTSIPLDLPAGPRGMKPELTLTYSSSSANEMKSRTTTGSWVGVGWNLGVPSIVKDPFGTYAYPTGHPMRLRGRYYLSMNGVSDLLVRGDTVQPDGLYRFHTKRESHLLITGKLCGTSNSVDSYYEFTVRTKEGTKYEFGNKPGGPSCAYADAGTANAPTSLQYFTRYWTEWHRYHYRMDVSRITDTRGNYIEFGYWQNVRDDCYATPCAKYVRAAYPMAIEWGGNVTGQGHVYRVLFNQGDFDGQSAAIGGWDDVPGSVGRVRYDSPVDIDAGDGTCQPHVMEVRSLTSVRVINLATGGQIVREYVPGYDKSDQRDPMGPGVCAISGNLKLTSWAEKGKDGSATLRTMTFDYVGSGNSDFQLRYRNGSAVDCPSPNSGAKPRPFISKATNGFGGEVRFSYRETWSPPSGQTCGWERMALWWRTADPDGYPGGIDHPHFYESLPGGQAPPYYVIPDWSVKPEDAEFRGFGWVRDTDAAPGSGDFSECMYELYNDFRIGSPNNCSWYEAGAVAGQDTRSVSYLYDIEATCTAACLGWDTPYFRESYFAKLIRTTEVVKGRATLWTDHLYDPYGNVLQQCDYAPPGPPAGICGTDQSHAPYRRTVTEYNYNASDSVYIVAAPKYVWRQSESTVYWKTAYFYDQQGIDTAPSYGILTKTDALADTGWINLNQFGHDTYGNVIYEWEYFNNDSGNFSDCETANCRLTTTDASACNNMQAASTTNPLGQTASFTYDCVLGLPLSVKDANGVTTETRYDDFGRPTKTWTYPDTETSPTETYSYAWDGTSPEKSAVGRRESGSGYLWSATCVDGLGRQVQQRRERSDGPPAKVIIADTTYDGSGYKQSESIPYEVNEQLGSGCPGTDSAKPKTSFTYDAVGRVASVTQPVPGGNAVVTTSYGAGGADPDEVRTRQDLGGGITVASDAQVDALGRTIRVQELNSNLSVYATTSYLYDQADQLYRVTDQAINVTNIGYDKAGWKKQLVDPDTGTWGYSYFNDGLLKTQTDPRTEVSTMAYDGLGRVTTKSYSGPITTSPITYSYDRSQLVANGELVQAPDAPPPENGKVYIIDNGSKRHVSSPSVMTACGYFWDRIVLVDDDMLATVPTGLQVTGAPCSTNADLITGTDGYVYVTENNVKRHIVDPPTFNACGYDWGRILTISQTAVDNITTGTTVTGPPCPQVNPYRYDSPVGHLTKVDDDPGESLFRYDERGQQIFQRDVRDSTNYDIARTYDSMGREKTLTYPDGEVVTTAYDVQGMPASLTSSLAPGTPYVSGATYNAADDPVAIPLGNTRTLGFGYRPEDLRLTSMSVSGGLLSNTYTYDKTFNVKTVTDNLGTLTYAYDHLNRLIGTTGSYDSTFAYDKIGNITAKRENEMYGGARETACADEVDAEPDGRINDGCTATYPTMCYTGTCGTGKPHTLKYAEGDNPAFKPGTGIEAYISTAFRSTYTYDASGNLTQVWGKNHVTDPNSDGSLGKLTTAEYDAEGRLLRIPYNKLDTVAGGMAFYDVSQNDCKYTLSDQVAFGPSYNRSIPDPAYNPLFDFNTDGRVTLSDQVLVGATFNTRCPTFVYDHSGQLARIEGRINLSGTAYGPYDRLYIGGVYEKALKTGEVTKYYSLGGRRVAMSKGGVVSYLASDHLGGTSLVMDAAGNATSRMRYHPYGQVWTQSAAPATDKLFTGHTRLGARSGMYYAGARFYSADLGRFMSADPLEPDYGASPQGLNLYSYVNGNPLRYADPTGMRLEDGWTQNTKLPKVAGPPVRVIHSRPPPRSSGPVQGPPAPTTLAVQTLPVVAWAVVAGASALGVCYWYCQDLQGLDFGFETMFADGGGLDEAIEAAKEEATERILDDPKGTLDGLSPEEAANVLPDSWNPRPARSKNEQGIRSAKPGTGGATGIRIMWGNPNASDALHQGPRAIVNRDGKTTVVPLR